MVKIVIVNGAPTSGKSTFVGMCLDKLGIWGREISTVDFVKEIAKQAGWDGIKRPDDRKFLSDLKDLLTTWNDVPFKKIKKAYDNFNFELAQYGMEHRTAYLFVHCREPEEIKKFKRYLGATTVLIRREVAENLETSNHADANVFEFEYDWIVKNNGDLEELKRRAEVFLAQIS